MSRKATSKMTPEIAAPSANGRPLPKGWQMVRFDELAQMVNERVDPSDTDADIYVGLEHLDPESLTLRRWGTPGDVIGDKLQFRKGDIIFGRRRAYQRKLAVAEFDGICSAHAMVVRAKTETVDPEFLPFLMQSDMFMQRAIDISVGSLSPTINWKTLRLQEFPLPPKDEQRRIADILWAADEAVESHRAAIGDFEICATAWATEFLSRKWEVRTLGDLLEDVQYGSSSRASDTAHVGNRILGIPNVIGGRIDLSDSRWIELPSSEIEKYRLEGGDVLIVRTNGNPDYVGRTAVVESVPEAAVYASYLIRLRTNRSVLLPTYLHCALSSRMLRTTLRHEIRSSAGNYNLNTKGIRNQRLPLPPIDEQLRFSETFAAFRERADQMHEHIRTLHAMKLRLTNSLLGGHR